MEREIKHTEIGDIPVDWKFQTFDKTFRVLSNNTLSRENLNNRSGAIRNIHYGDILTKFPEVLDCNKEKIPYVNDLSMLSSSTQLLQDGDIVVADTAEDETVGKVTEVQNLGDSKLVAGLHTIPCRVKKGDFAPGWLGYYMNSDLFHNQILPYITGIKVSSISKGAISETLILVPPFDEQEKIVQTLNEVQLLMTAETKVVNKIKFVKNGCLSKMFPQKDDPVPEMRLPGFTAAWEQRKLGATNTFFTDGNYGEAYPKSSDMTDSGSGIPFLTGGNLKDGKLSLDGASYITPEKHSKLTSGHLLEDDIVIAVRGSLGALGYVNTDNSGWNINSQLAILRTDKSELYGKFLIQYLLSWTGQNELLKRQTGSALKQLPIGAIKDVEVPITSIAEQGKIGEYFADLDHLITLHQRKCDKYSNIKKGMMNDLLTGKIRLV